LSIEIPWENKKRKEEKRREDRKWVAGELV
jgi:hypothetical protein